MASTAIVPLKLGSVDHDPSGKGFKLENDETTPGNLKYYGTDGAGGKGFHSLPIGTGEIFQIYEIAEGFWTEGTPGILAVKDANGVFSITVPDGGHYKRIWKDIVTAPGDLDGAGALSISISRDNSTDEGGPSTVNLSRASSMYPVFHIVDSSGVQRNPGDVFITIANTVGLGETSSTITGINGLGLPVQLIIL